MTVLLVGAVAQCIIQVPIQVLIAACLPTAARNTHPRLSAQLASFNTSTRSADEQAYKVPYSVKMKVHQFSMVRDRAYLRSGVDEVLGTAGLDVVPKLLHSGVQ